MQLHLVLQHAGIGERAALPASVRAVRAAALPSLPLHNVLCHRIWARLLRDGPPLSMYRTHHTRGVHRAPDDTACMMLHVLTHANCYIDCNCTRRTQPGHCTRELLALTQTGDSLNVSRLVIIVK